jgi:hypothetical protein
MTGALAPFSYLVTEISGTNIVFENLVYTDYLMVPRNVETIPNGLKQSHTILTMQFLSLLFLLYK